MKKRILSLFVLLALLASVVSCSSESVAEHTEIPQYSGSGSNVIKNELAGASIVGVIGRFADIISTDFSTAGAFGAYDFGLAFKVNKEHLNASVKDGVFSYSRDNTVQYAASYGTDGLKLVEYSENSGYALSESAATGNANVKLMLLKIKDTLVFVKEHFELPSIEESDIKKGEDGLYYLGVDYTEELIYKFTVASHCTSEGVLPSELTEDELFVLSERAKTFSESSGFMIGFGLNKVKKINSMRVAFSAEGITEYTEGEIDAADIDVFVKLDSNREHIESVSGSCRTVSGKNGNLDLEFNLTTAFNQSGVPVRIEADVTASLFGIKIGEENADGEQTVIPVLGNKTLALNLKFNPYSLDKSLELAFSDVAYRIGVTDAVYSGTSVSVSVGRFNKNEPTDVTVKYTLMEEGASTTTLTLGGKFYAGDSVQADELPQEVKDLLEIN